jgi:hypothetical protein
MAIGCEGIVLDTEEVTHRRGISSFRKHIFLIATPFL